MEKNKDKFKTRYFEIHESHKLSSHGNYLRRTNFIFIKAKRNLESRRFRSIERFIEITIEEISRGKILEEDSTRSRSEL